MFCVVSKERRGFTMVELLVVISIIGILVTILYANFSQAKMQSRDKVRKAELKELQLAIELYKAQNGQYPAAGCGAASWVGPGPMSNIGESCEEYIVGLTPDFIASLPRDPNQENDENKGFLYKTNGTSYKVIIFDSVEGILVSSLDEEFSRYPSHCSLGVQEDEYAVYSAGADCW